jgi:hypothetical protein
MDEFTKSATLAAVVFFEWLPLGVFIIAAWFLLDRLGAVVTRTMTNRYETRGDE